MVHFENIELKSLPDKIVEYYKWPYIWVYERGRELWRAFHKEHTYLLAGFSGSGKTELHIALADLREKGNHSHHSESATPNSDKEIRIDGKRVMVFRDGGGSVDHSEFRRPTYVKFIDEARSAGADNYSLLFLVDLSTFGNVNQRKHVKSELLYLNGVAEERFPEKPDTDKRIDMIVIGTHIDLLPESDRDQAKEKLVADTLKWIDPGYFAPRCLTADLYHDETAKEFAKELFGVE